MCDLKQRPTGVETYLATSVDKGARQGCFTLITYIYAVKLLVICVFTFFTKVKNAHMTGRCLIWTFFAFFIFCPRHMHHTKENFLFELSYAFYEHFLRCPRFSPNARNVSYLTKNKRDQLKLF